MKKILSLILSLTPAWCQAAAFSPYLKADLRAGQTSEVGDVSSNMGSGNVLAVPVVKFSDADILMPVFLVNASGTQPVLEEDTLFSRRALIDFKPMVTHKFSPEVSGKLRLEY